KFESGKFDAGTDSILIAQPREFQSLEDIRNLIINGGTGEFVSGLIRLGDIADITMGYQTPALAENRYNGEPAVTWAVSPVQGINVVSLGDTIQDIIANY
ncbi:efflux RND transporter permease subunit, partial [Vibrio parahaemolyticus]|uniref:efflux RND transporter permease subunit n=1 Tax=Vibrio parahaemolyticus TaxID=670 RepID=UPI00211188F2